MISKTRILGAIAVTLTLAGCASSATRPPAPLATHPPVTRGAYARPMLIGAAANDYGTFQSQTGVTPRLMEHYIDFGDPFHTAFAGPAEPMIEINPATSLQNVIAGKDDAWLKSYSSAVAAWKNPLIIGFAPEMNGSWYAYGFKHSSPALYIKAYRHVVSVFRSQKAANVKWLWDVSISFPQFHGPTNSTTLNVKQWWPGSSYVDYIGLDGYFYNTDVTFAQLFNPTIRAVEPFNKPTLIAEAGAPAGPRQATNIASLINGARSADMVAVVYFDLKGNKDWRITSTSSLAAFMLAAKG